MDDVFNNDEDDPDKGNGKGKSAYLLPCHAMQHDSVWWRRAGSDCRRPPGRVPQDHADTNAPRVLLAWLFATNTIGAVLFQVPVSRTVTGLQTAMRAEARAAAFMVASCLIILVTDHTVIWLTIPLIWLAHVTVTGAELFESSASWSLQSELSDQAGSATTRGSPPSPIPSASSGPRRSTPCWRPPCTPRAG